MTQHKALNYIKTVNGLSKVSVLVDPDTLKTLWTQTLAEVGDIIASALHPCSAHSEECATNRTHLNNFFI